MTLPNIFTEEISEKTIHRINQLKPDTTPGWGKMTVDQMLAHCNVTYEMVFTDKHPKPNIFMRFILKSFVKNMVVSGKPYKRNSQTAPAFLIKGERDFNAEKQRLIGYITDTQKLGENYFDGKESNSFGALTKDEWNSMFYKHLDHHLTQFGV